MEPDVRGSRTPPASLLNIVKVEDEPVDFGFQPHGLYLLEGVIQPPEMTANSMTVTVKDEPNEITEFDPPVHSRRRQRVVMDFVLVPTLAEVQRKKNDDEDDLRKLKNLFKPKKGKAAEFTLSNAVLMSRLKPVGLDRFPVDLPLAELNQMVSRRFMASTYGGSMQATVPSIGAAKLAQHGMNDFMYLHIKYHPYAPQRPGGSGLCFDPEWYGAPFNGVYRVFTRDRRRAIWQYMGQYDVKQTASLTLAEWLGLEARQNWAKGICDMDWGNGVCARIQARKDIGPDREPTQEEVMTVLDGKEWSTTQDDIMVAFDSGKEKMGVWTMKCIGYDDRFQRELYDRYPTWAPPESSKIRKKGKHTKGVKEEVKAEELQEEFEVEVKVKVRVKVKVKKEDEIFPSAKASGGKKRKRAVTADSEATSGSGAEMRMKDEAKDIKKVDDEEKALMTIRMGTKSRTRL